MTDRLYFTDSDAANELLVREQIALLIGFALDQQVTVQKAFSGPLAIKERVGIVYLPLIVGQIYRWADKDPPKENGDGDPK